MPFDIMTKDKTTKEYYCKCCSYHTTKLSSFKDHFSSEKHLKKIKIKNNDMIITNYEEFKKELFICENCNNIYTTKKSLKIHKCKDKISANEKSKDKQIEALIIKLDEKDKAIYKSIDANFYSSKANNTSMNIFRYAQKYLMNVNPLNELKNEDTYDVINYNNPKNEEKINEEYIKTIIHKFNHNIFSDFIGDMIILRYKPKTAKDRNLITTDLSRLCFIMMQRINTDDKNIVETKEWINDKSGERFIKIILDPILVLIKKIIDDFLIFNQGKILNESLLVLMSKCIELKRDIEVKILNESLLVLM